MTSDPGTMHVLLSVTRDVPATRLSAYAAAWRRLRDAAAQAGVHAWHFRSAAAAEAGRFLEFLEWHSAGGDPTVAGPLRAALAQLDAAFPGERDVWHEVPSESSAEGAP